MPDRRQQHQLARHVMLGRARSEDGFTLPELLVTISMSMIIALGAFGLLETAMKRTGETQSRVEATQRGRQALDVMTRQLRSQVCLSSSTPAMVVADPLSATFYVDLSDGTQPVAQRIEKRVLAYLPAERRIVEHTYRATPGKTPTEFPAAPDRTKELLSNVVPPEGESAIFRYYAFSTATPPKPDLEFVSPTATSQLGRIARIEIAYTTLAGEQTGPKPPRGSVELRGQVYLRAADPNDPAPYPTCA